MDRHTKIETIGSQYYCPNTENGEWSYARDAGDSARLREALDGERPDHFTLDIRFADSDETGDYAVLIETKSNFEDSDENQLRAYVEEEYALHRGTKLIAILANTDDGRIKVWKSEVDDDHLLCDETALDTMEHYKKLFSIDRQNDREKVMRNTYALNELLHRKDINEKNRSQFVGTALLFLKNEVENHGHGGRITEEMTKVLQER